MNHHLLKNYLNLEYIKRYNLCKKQKNIKWFSYAPIPKRVGFTKPTIKLNRKAQKYIVNVQWLKRNDVKKLEKLCSSIKKDANSFNSYELIDLIYYLSKHSYKNIYLTIEPLLFHFFLKYNTSVNLNGISIHRLLRVLTEYQDLVYREWIYLIAKIVSKKHAHISMRDIQLILDDLALFYDFQIQYQISSFYKTIINRINELEVKRIPFLIHVIGRIGCNNNELYNVLFSTLKKNMNRSELYRSDFSGLILRGLANLKILPDKNMLYQLYKPLKDNINCTNIKYISWCADGFARLNYYFPLPLLVDQMLKMKDSISHLELNDFSSILNCIQAYILIKQYNAYNVNAASISKETKFVTDNKNVHNCLYNNQNQNSNDILASQTNNEFQYIKNNDHLEKSHNPSLFSEDSKFYPTEFKKIQKKEIMHESNAMNQIKMDTTQNEEEITFPNLGSKLNLVENENSNENKIGVEKKRKCENKSNNLDIRLRDKESNKNLNENLNLNEMSLNKRPLCITNTHFDINDGLISTDELYDIYVKLENLILEKINESVYNSTPPYRVIMFELMTRLFRFYNKPIDLIIEMKTHRYDTSLLLKHTNTLQLIISNENSRQKSSSGLSFYVKQFNFSNEFFWRNIKSTKRDENLSNKKVEKTENNTLDETHKNVEDANIPLPKILKNFLHSIFFRTPALGGRTIMLLLIALVRLNFGEREKLEYLNPVNSHILPFMKANEIYRPLTKCIIREIVRKVETFNVEELIICTICLHELDVLDLNQDFFSMLIDRLVNLKKNNYMSNDQILQLKKLFNFWFNRNTNLVKSLSFNSIKQIKKNFFA